MTPNERNVCILAYNYYLKNNAMLEGRGYRLTKKWESVTKSTFFKIFFKLTFMLFKSKITKPRDIGLFFEKARVLLKDDFNPMNIVTSYPDIVNMEYDQSKNIHDIYKLVKKSFDNIKNACIIENMEFDKFITEGRPPLIMKSWKAGKVDVYTMVGCLDIPKLKKNSWFKIYCGGKMPEITNAMNVIKQDEELKEIIKSLRNNLTLVK
jgi:hypothetical protein